MSQLKKQICEPKMKFEECELAILRNAVDNAEKAAAEKVAMGPEIKKIMEIVENFLKTKKVICYGGTAINNILPTEAQFYDRRVDIPDYDFFSTTPIQHSKELCDIYYAAGYKDVEAKSGVHQGTYKVFVNFIPVADITLQDKQIFKNLWKESIIVDGIHYASANWLRMGMYLELSRPLGDISRWEKVLTRLTLLNRHYPLKAETNCYGAGFQRAMEDYSAEESEKIYNVLHDTFIKNRAVFFGSFAMSLYSEYMTASQRGLVKKIADFDVFTEKAKSLGLTVVQNLKAAGFKQVKLMKHKALGEIIPIHYEVVVGRDTVAFIYEPNECINYNIVKIQNQSVNIATIDTILRYYLSFLYTGRDYFNTDRLICMAHFLFVVQQKNRLNQRGILKRFTMDCIGKQKTLEDIRAEKAEQFRILRKDKENPEYEKWFLKYVPADLNSESAVTAAPATAAAPADTPTPAPASTKRKRKAKRKTKKSNFLW